MFYLDKSLSGPIIMSKIIYSARRSPQGSDAGVATEPNRGEVGYSVEGRKSVTSIPVAGRPTRTHGEAQEPHLSLAASALLKGPTMTVETPAVYQSTRLLSAEGPTWPGKVGASYLEHSRISTLDTARH